MLLSNDEKEFKIAIDQAAVKMRIAKPFIEKDYYAISILKELVKRNDRFVFKGGTSLSVCQKIINRFSEDIDISYADEIITIGTKRAIKQTFFDSIETVSLKVSNSENIRSRRVFNRYLCPYVSICNDTDINNNKVIVEWAIITPSFPIEEKTAQTLIGQYFESINRHDLVEKYGLESFTVKTITKERTFVDKIFAICDYHISKKLERQSRHIYDISRLLQCVKLDDALIQLFLKVRDYRKGLETCYSSKEGMVVSDLLIELIEEKTYLTDYNSKTFGLLYDGVKYEECILSIKQIAEFLKKHNL